MSDVQGTGNWTFRSMQGRSQNALSATRAWTTNIVQMDTTTAL